MRFAQDAIHGEVFLIRLHVRVVEGIASGTENVLNSLAISHGIGNRVEIAL